MGRVQFKGLHGTWEFHWEQPLTAHHLLHCVAIRWYQLEDPSDEPLARLWHPNGHCVGPLHDASLQFGHRFCSEWHGACNHKKQHHPKGPDIHKSANVILIPKELWCSVRWRATERVERLIAAALRAKSEVPHFDAGVTGVENIFCLQVTVNDVVFML